MEKVLGVVQEMYDVEYHKYLIIFTLLHGGSLNQLKMEVYYTPEEAYESYKYLNGKIVQLVNTNSSIALSLVCRNSEGDVVHHGISGIVGIEHNIPQFKEVFDEE